jgi:hypothetical protein
LSAILETLDRQVRALVSRELAQDPFQPTTGRPSPVPREWQRRDGDAANHSDRQGPLPIQLLSSIARSSAGMTISAGRHDRDLSPWPPNWHRGCTASAAWRIPAFPPRARAQNPRLEWHRLRPDRQSRSETVHLNPPNPAS